MYACVRASLSPSLSLSLSLSLSPSLSVSVSLSLFAKIHRTPCRSVNSPDMRRVHVRYV